MDIKDITPDLLVYLQWGFLKLNATILFTWLVMGLIALVSHLLTRNLTSGVDIPRSQGVLEAIILGLRSQIEDIMPGRGESFLPFLGTLFLFIAVTNVLAVVPGFIPPTASLSTTVALALCVLATVVLRGVSAHGPIGYLKLYAKPSPMLLPFNVIGEFSRTLALAVRLFGNVMSGTKIVAILLAIAPLFFPIVMNILGLLTGLLQAYIFAILAAVYIASATSDPPQKRNIDPKE
ncbi:MAG: F0F1 ATP synthase subunit A [Deltaproteobacteria bacterium]|nr:F0F1 ATP synthase subunit A [Deltaproteobacteria bacterium]